MTAYATVTEADTYFESRLHSGTWIDASTADKTKALAMATQQIDHLDFAIAKNDEDQELEFPRGDDTVVPEAIKKATYEIAIELLDDNLPDELLADSVIKQDNFANVRTTYDRRATPEHIVNGVVSATAWRFLRPYLEEPGNIKLHRVS